MESEALNGRQRFINVMSYQAVDRIPNYEAGVWGQTKQRWIDEGLNEFDLHWDWWAGEASFGMDAREFIPVNYGMMPAFAHEVLERTERYEIFRDTIGRTHKALIDGTVRGTRASMDQYLSFAVRDLDDFRKLQKRYIAGLEARYPARWREIMLPGWKIRQHPLILGQNCSTLGFYWLARDWMGTEQVCYSWYDQPELMHEMMAFIADFTIEVSRPILLETDIDYVMLNEDMSMKTGPLLSPEQYRTFIYPHMKRLVAFLKSNGVRYVIVDSDGNCEALIPLLLECGVDAIWPLERAANMDPVRIRRTFGRDLRLFGGVDKMELAKGKSAIDCHLAQLVPLIEEGGFIPTVDHTVSPDISLENFRYYIKRKQDLLNGTF
ncbi:MAG: uroporphyrinogen decarboxylase family protein [Bacillota bacterium]|nr:uroporphyrinogen decarboxylase family protein [Bacillota bacterium]